MRTFHISQWLFLLRTRGPVRVHGDTFWVGVGRFDMATLVVQKKKKKRFVWPPKFREKIPISNLKTAQFKGSFKGSSQIFTADAKQEELRYKLAGKCSVTGCK